MYKTLLAEKVESEHILRKKLQDQQLQMEDVVSEAKRKIVSVRTFWKDQIFRNRVDLELLSKELCVKRFFVVGVQYLLMY